MRVINPLTAELNPICHMLTLLGAHHILHISRIEVNIKCHLAKYRRRSLSNYMRQIRVHIVFCKINFIPTHSPIVF
jgi:hypothetical protein